MDAGDTWRRLEALGESCQVSIRIEFADATGGKPARWEVAIQARGVDSNEPPILVRGTHLATVVFEALNLAELRGWLV